MLSTPYLLAVAAGYPMLSVSWIVACVKANKANSKTQAPAPQTPHLVGVYSLAAPGRSYELPTGRVSLFGLEHKIFRHCWTRLDLISSCVRIAHEGLKQFPELQQLCQPPLSIFSGWNVLVLVPPDIAGFNNNLIDVIPLITCAGGMVVSSVAELAALTSSAAAANGTQEEVAEMEIDCVIVDPVSFQLSSDVYLNHTSAMSISAESNDGLMRQVDWEAVHNMLMQSRQLRNQQQLYANNKLMTIEWVIACIKLGKYIDPVESPLFTVV